MSKKAYCAPEAIVEVYVLDASIASNCTTVVTEGPVQPGTEYEVCDDYYEAIGVQKPQFSMMRAPANINFHEKCDCYTTGDNGQFFTS